MNVVHLLRSTARLTQAEMAVRAGTSQPTIAAYETGMKSPTLSTLQRMATVLGLDLVINCVPKLTREDRRSLMYHRAIVEKLRHNAPSILARARHTLRRMRREHPHAKPLFDCWSAWLKLPLEALILHLLDTELAAREMRHVSPFAGILQPHERVQVVRRFRSEEGV